MSKKETVAILYGGKSVEHQISINSGRNVYGYIDKHAYDTILIGISEEGKWFLKDEVDGNFDGLTPLKLSLDPQAKGFWHNDTLIKVDIVFLILHGTDGEDGNIQGLLTAMEIPFVGTGVLGSALAMSKLYSKKLLQAKGIPVGGFLSYETGQRDNISYDKIEAELGLPFMAKAANLGSSVGVFKVKGKADFERTIDEVFRYDDTVIFEQFIAGRELECSVMGNDTPEASLPAEIVVSDAHEFYTYEAKYLDPDAAKLQVPAVVGEAIAERIRQLSIAAYQALACQDFARVDLFLTDDNEIFINEINTIPGFTNSSMFPMMWQERGINFTELITRLIKIAQKRYAGTDNIVKQYRPS